MRARTENPQEDCLAWLPWAAGVGGSLQDWILQGDFLEEAAPKETV